MSCEICGKTGKERDIYDIESNSYKIVLCQSHYASYMAHGLKAVDKIISKIKNAKETTS
jgi:hypothetical protein